MRFDAYAGNVYGGSTAAEVAEVLAHGTKGMAARGRPRGRYTDVFEVRDCADPVGFVGWDRVLEAAYFEFKGARTPDAAGTIRRHWPDTHGVSRVDACEDFDDAEAFGQLVELVDRTHADPRLKSREWRPRNDPEAGRTVYWGSPTSKLQVRVYEAGKMVERRALGRPHWSRIEAQVRPGKAAEKRLAATVSPVEAWGFSTWSSRVAEALCRVDVARCAIHPPPATHDRTTLYLARTFRRHLEGMLEDLGAWDCVGLDLEAVWRADDAAAAAVAAATELARSGGVPGAIDHHRPSPGTVRSRPGATGAAPLDASAPKSPAPLPSNGTPPPSVLH